MRSGGPSSPRARPLAALASLLAASTVACTASSDRSRHGERIAAARQALEPSALDGSSLGAKELVLTFDDGPGVAAVTGELAAWLASRPAPIRATFFVNGACVGAVPATLTGNESCTAAVAGAAATLDELIRLGHTVANHATTHRDLTAVPADELEDELAATDVHVAPRSAYGRLFFRAPHGGWSAAVHGALEAGPMRKYTGPIGWDIGAGPTDTTSAATRAADRECWQLGATTHQCGDRYLNEIRARTKGIVRLHDAAGATDNHEPDVGTGNTVDLVKYIVPVLEAEGFTFRPLEEVPAIAAELPRCHATCATCSGPGAESCVTCPPGAWRDGGTCRACTPCSAGAYTATACTTTADAVCAACTACPSGSYEVAACTTTADRACAPCDPSCTECSGPASTDCTCGAGMYLAAGECYPCSTCSAGTEFVAACTPTADTICALCGQGTYSSDGQTACQPCPEGTYAAFAAATGCAECGACNDDDPCTKDSCAVTTGCVHERIEGCRAPRLGTGEGVIDDDSSYYPVSGPSGRGSDVSTGCRASPSGPGRRGPVGRGAVELAFAGLLLAARRRSRAAGRGA